MYNNYRFERNARNRRVKAVILTIFFHLLLAGAFLWVSNPDVEEYLPEFVKEWFDQDAAVEEEAPAAETSQPQP